MIPASIFRAYDIRGIAFDTLSEDCVYKIGLALGTLAQQRGFRRFVLARDGRLSGPELSVELRRGLLNSGCDVVDIGIAPSPVLYFATYALEIECGVVLTASHNPAPDNGVKPVINYKSLTPEDIQTVFQMIQNKKFTYGEGILTKRADVIDLYLDRIVSNIHLDRPLKVVVDSGNGVAALTAARLFKRLGCEVVKLFCDLDGHFPNHHPDPSIPENLEDLLQAVKEHDADIGLAFDGDADRLGVISSDGQIIWPDRQMILFAQDVLSRHAGAEIIYDVKCSRILAAKIKEYGGHPVMWKTGHSFTKSKLNESPKALLAGEMSGHIFFKERWYGFDDGVYAGARLLEILSHSPEKSEVIFNAIPKSINTPELKLPVDEAHKFALMTALEKTAEFPGAEINRIDGLRVDYPDGWGLVRASNTSAYLILRFEADTQEAFERIQEEFRRVLLKADKGLVLPF